MYDKMIREIKAIDDKPTRNKRVWELLKLHKENLFDWAVHVYDLTEDECEFIYKQRPCFDWDNLLDLGDWFSEAVDFYIQCKNFLTNNRRER